MLAMNQVREKTDRFTGQGVHGPAVITWITTGTWTWMNKSTKAITELKIEHTGLADIYVPDEYTFSGLGVGYFVSGYFIRPES